MTRISAVAPADITFSGTPPRRAEAAGTFIGEIEDSMRFLRQNDRFTSAAHRAIALGRFQPGRDVFINLARLSSGK